MIVVCLVGAAHAGTVGQPDWAARLPVVWLEGLNTRSTAGRLYQAFFLFAFVLGPMFCVYAFLRRFSKAVVIDKAGLEAPFPPLCRLSCPQAIRDRYIVGDGLTQDMVKNQELAQMVNLRSVDWLPPWEQWLVLGLFALAGASVLWLLWRVFRYSAIRPTG